MVNLLVLCVVCLLICASIGFYYSQNELPYKEAEFQGPVPVGYSLEHFRQTGETIKEVFN